MTFPSFDEIKVTTAMQIGYLQGSVILNHVYALLPITVIDLLPQKGGKKNKMPVCLIPGAILSVRHGINGTGYARGICKSNPVKFFPNAVMLDMGTSDKTVNMRISVSTIHLCGIKEEGTSLQAIMLMVAHLHRIQNILNWIQTYPDKAKRIKNKVLSEISGQGYYYYKNVQLTNEYFCRKIFFDHHIKYQYANRKNPLSNKENSSVSETVSSLLQTTQQTVYSDDELEEEDWKLSDSDSESEEKTDSKESVEKLSVSVRKSQFQQMSQTKQYLQQELIDTIKITQISQEDVFNYFIQLSRDFSSLNECRKTLQWVLSCQEVCSSDLALKEIVGHMVNLNFYLGFSPDRLKLALYFKEDPKAQHFYADFKNDETHDVTVELPYETDKKLKGRQKNRKKSGKYCATFKIPKSGKVTLTAPDFIIARWAYNEFMSHIVKIKENIILNLNSEKFSFSL